MQRVRNRSRRAAPPPAWRVSCCIALRAGPIDVSERRRADLLAVINGVRDCHGCASRDRHAPLTLWRRTRHSVLDMRRSPIFGGGSFEIVVVASSLGGLDALGRILAPLPADFPAPIVVVD